MSSPTRVLAGGHHGQPTDGRRRFRRPHPRTRGHLGTLTSTRRSGTAPFASPATSRASNGCGSTTSRCSFCAAISARLAGSNSNRGSSAALTKEYTYEDGSPPGFLRPGGAPQGARRGRHRPGAAVSHHRHLLGRQRRRSRTRHRLHPRLQPLAGGLLRPRSEAALSGGPHLADRSRGCGGRGDPRTEGRVRRRLPLAGRAGSQRPAAVGPRLRPVLGDGAGPRHADRLPRRGARGERLPPHAGAQCWCRLVLLRLSGHRRDGGVHGDDLGGPLRALSEAQVLRPRSRRQLDLGLAGSPGSQVRGDEQGRALQVEAERVLLPAVPHLHGPGRGQ